MYLDWGEKNQPVLNLKHFQRLLLLCQRAVYLETKGVRIEVSLKLARLGYQMFALHTKIQRVARIY